MRSAARNSHVFPVLRQLLDEANVPACRLRIVLVPHAAHLMYDDAPWEVRRKLGEALSEIELARGSLSPGAMLTTLPPDASMLFAALCVLLTGGLWAAAARRCGSMPRGCLRTAEWVARLWGHVEASAASSERAWRCLLRLSAVGRWS